MRERGSLSPDFIGYGQAFTPLGAAAAENILTMPVGHSFAVAVFVLSLAIGRLVSALHFITFYLYLAYFVDKTKSILPRAEFSP